MHQHKMFLKPSAHMFVCGVCVCVCVCVSGYTSDILNHKFNLGILLFCRCAPPRGENLVCGHDTHRRTGAHPECAVVFHAKRKPDSRRFAYVNLVFRMLGCTDCVCVCVYTHTHTYTHTYTHTHAHTHTHTVDSSLCYICVCVCVCVYIHICIYAHTHIYTHIEYIVSNLLN